MSKLHIHTGTEDEQLVPEIMQLIDGYRATHRTDGRAMRQLVALHEMLKNYTVLSKKPAHKEKEKREEKEGGSATARRGHTR